MPYYLHHISEEEYVAELVTRVGDKADDVVIVQIKELNFQLHFKRTSSLKKRSKRQFVRPRRFNERCPSLSATS